MQLSAIVIRCRLSVVCKASALWQKNWIYDHAVFTKMYLSASTLPVKFDDEIKGVPSIGGGLKFFLTTRSYIAETVRDRASVTIIH